MTAADTAVTATPSAGRPAIDVADLSHRFGDIEALDAVSLTVAPGSFASLVGPSGCGKSTLLRIIAGLLVPTAGSTAVNGQPSIGTPGLVGFMPQRDLLLPWYRAIDNACVGGDVAGCDRAATRRRAAELFERFGLAGFERSWPSQLSGGMRQRLALLRTYLTGANVLLLDEPFGALDAITRRDLHGWLQQLWLTDLTGAAVAGWAEWTTALLVTHDVEEALYLSDHVYVMSARPGRLVDTVHVEVPRPRPPQIVTEPAFVALKQRLLHALDAGRRV